MRVAIVGNGVAGIEAARTIRARDRAAEITLVSEESDHFFSRTALMYVLSGQMSHADIEPYERDLYATLGLKRMRARAVGVDVERRQLELLGPTRTLGFDQLVIACGSRPRKGPWPGSDLPGVGHFVTLQDLGWLELELYGKAGRSVPENAEAHLEATEPTSPYRPRAVASQKRGRLPSSPVVVGGGLIGIEVVETLLAAGLRPRFIIREDWFWPIAINRDEAAWIVERLRGHGVEVLLGHNIQRFEAADDGTVAKVVTDKGTFPCDLAVIAIGVEPNTEWLRSSAITLDDRGGIVVDSHLQTNAPSIYAAGDCASVRWYDGSRRPEQLWYTSRDQGRVVGQNVLGDSASYGRGTWYNSAKLMDIEYTTAGLVGHKLEGERELFFVEKGKVESTTRIVERNGAVIGFNLLGRRWDHEVLVRFIEEKRDLDYVRKHLNKARFDTEFVPPLKLGAA